MVLRGRWRLVLIYHPPHLLLRSFVLAFFDRFLVGFYGTFWFFLEIVFVGIFSLYQLQNGCLFLFLVVVLRSKFRIVDGFVSLFYFY